MIVALPGPVANNVTMILATTGTFVIQGTIYEPDGLTPAAVGAQLTAYSPQSRDVLGKAISVAGGAYTLVIP